MFKYSAFTENTPEMRKWLEDLGYSLFCPPIKILDVPHSRYKYLETIPQSSLYIPTIKIKPDYMNTVDCIGNHELFKAITAINDQNDYMQWFIVDEFIQCGVGGNVVGLETRKKIGEKWILYQNNDLRLTNSIKQDIMYSYYGKSDMRKATIEELKEYFKI